MSEQELCDLVSIASGNTPSKKVSSYWQGSLPWISAASMHGVYASKSERRLTCSGKEQAKLARRNDLLILTRGSMLYKRVPICKVETEVAFNQDVKRLRTNNKVDFNYLFHALTAKEQFLMSRVVGTGIGAGKLSTETLLSMTIPVPTLPEQKKIAAFLSAVDDKLAAVRVQLLGWRDYKRGMMQALFSQSLRFKDDDGSEFHDWTQRALGSILKERKASSVKGLGLEHVSLTKKGVVPKSKRYNRDFLVNDDTTKKYKITRKGDLCYNPANLKFGVISINDYSDGIFSPIYVTFVVKDGFTDYLRHLVNDLNFRARLLRFEQGTVYERQSVHSTDFIKVKVNLPSLPEQKKIADALSAIDAKIDALTQRLDSTQEFKRGLLQKMFV